MIDSSNSLVLWKYYDFLLTKEKEVSSFVCTIAEESKVKLIGYENRIKNKESVILKCNRIDHLLPPVFYIYDVLRYTILLKNDDFEEKYREITNRIHVCGYDIVRVKNTWIEFENGIPYRGLNCIILGLKGVIFEIQFHTIDSYFVNEETHTLYRKMFLDSTNRDVIADRINEIVRNLVYPKGIRNIKNQIDDIELLRRIELFAAELLLK